jgi:D-alanyl-D-alanine carboxypeptidase
MEGLAWRGGRIVRGRRAALPGCRVRRWPGRASARGVVLALSLGLVAAVGLSPLRALAAAQLPPPPVISGRAAAVLNGATGAVLWSYHGHLRLPMASTTKMMTALVALGLTHDRTGQTMVVPPQVLRTYGQTLNLQPGDRYTFLQLLEGMLLFSANDAAMAIAVDTAGSEHAFVQLMNRRARQLGLFDTHFANPDGLDNPDHFSSAIDLARLGVAALQNPVIRRIVQMRDAVIPAPQGHGWRMVDNIDSLLLNYPGATGIKTGYTSEALNVVVGSATRGNHSVVGVVTGEPAADLWQDAAAVLNYGFALEAAGDAGQVVRPATVVVQARLVRVPVTGPAAPEELVPAGSRVGSHPLGTAVRGPRLGAWAGRVFPLLILVLGGLAMSRQRARRRARRRRRRAGFSPGPTLVRGSLPDSDGA